MQLKSKSDLELSIGLLSKTKNIFQSILKNYSHINVGNDKNLKMIVHLITIEVVVLNKVVRLSIVFDLS